MLSQYEKGAYPFRDGAFSIGRDYVSVCLYTYVICGIVFLDYVINQRKEKVVLPHPQDIAAVHECWNGGHCISKGFELVQFGARTRMTSYAVIHKDLLFCCTHQIHTTAAYFFRRIGSEPRNAYGIVSNPRQIGKADLVVCDINKPLCEAPILIQREIILEGVDYCKIGEERLVTCLLNGERYAATTYLNTDSGKVVLRIETPSYPGLSGTGFVDEDGNLSILSCSDETEEGTFLVPILG